MSRNHSILVPFLLCVTMALGGCDEKESANINYTGPKPESIPRSDAHGALSTAEASTYADDTSMTNSGQSGDEEDGTSSEAQAGRSESDENELTADNLAISEAMNKLALEGNQALAESRRSATSLYTVSGRSTYCGEDSNCPWSEGVGTISTTEGDCVATLVAKDVVVTAGHCVGDYEPGTTIGGLFSLPRIVDGDRIIGSESVALKNVLAQSNGQYGDFAFVSLQMEAKYHEPLKISREGFQDGGFYSFIGTDLVVDSPTFNQWALVDACYSSFSNVFSPHYDHAKDPMVTLSSCPIGAGNSGAPVLNIRNEVVGIVRGHVNKDLYALALFYLLKFGFTSFDNHAFLAGVTNFACIPDVIAGEPVVPGECNQFGGESLRANHDKNSILINQFEGQLNSSVEVGGFSLANGELPIFQTTFVWTPPCVDESQIQEEGDQQFIPTILYSPIIDEQFATTSELSEPFETRLYLEDGTSDDEYLASLEYLEGVDIFRAHLPVCPKRNPGH